MIAANRVAPWRRGVASPADDPLRAVRVGYLAVVVAAALVQAVLFGGDADNLPCVAMALAGSVIGIAASLQPERFARHPVSALILFFFTTTGLSGALIVKTLEWAPVVDRLQVPRLTFGVLLACQLVLLAADALYRRAAPLQRLVAGATRRVVEPLGLLRWPPEAQLWMLGAIGCVAVTMTGTDHESAASFGMATAGQKVIRAFAFLKFAPLLIPFRPALSGEPGPMRTPVAALLGYFVLLVLISFATNSRSTFADAIPTMAIALLMAVGMGRLDLRRLDKGRLLGLAAVAGVGALLLSRVALAMVVVRDYRYTVDVGTLIGMTLDALFDSEWVEAARARMDSAEYVGGYSEVYVDSRFFSRFLLTKFHDNILYYCSLFGDDNTADYRQFMLDRLLGSLPDPMLRALGISIDKSDLVISNGDYIVYIVDGWGLGGFKTGSMIGEVYSMFGWGFPLVLGAAALMLFVAYDVFVGRDARGVRTVSPLLLLLAWNLMGTTAAFGLGGETVVVIPAGILRGLVQYILFYVIAVAAVGALSRLAGWTPAPPRWQRR